MDKKRWTIFLAILAGAAALFFLLPRALGLSPVAGYLLGRINSALPGEVRVRSCSLGWFRGLECTDVLYEYPDQGIRLKAPGLATDKGLLALLLAPNYLGEITLRQPVISVVADPEASQVADAAPGAAESKPVPADMARGAQPWWERCSLRLRVDQGTIFLDRGQEERRELAHALNLHGSLAGGTVNYVLDFESGKEQGRFHAEGFVNLPAARMTMLDALISRADLTISGVELAPFLDLAASRWNAPRGAGRLDASVQLVTAGLDEVKMNGEATLAELKLAGGILGKDEPSLAGMKMRFSGSCGKKEGWRFTSLKIDADPLRLQAKGQLDSNTVAFDAEGEINLPAVAAQLPHLLHLQEQTRIGHGLVNFSLRAAGSPDDLQTKVDCRVARLEAVHNDQAFVWDAPLVLTAEADYRQGGLAVRDLQLKTPFLQASGSGAADDFTLKATADLEQMSSELVKLFALGYSGKGKLALAGASRREEDGSFRLDAHIDVSGLTLFKGRELLQPAHDFSLTGEARGPATLYRDGRFMALRAEAVAWPGKLALRLGEAEAQAHPEPGAFVAKGELDLERTAALLRGLNVAALPEGLAGALTVAGEGQWQAPRLTLSRLDGQVEKLRLYNGASRFQTPKLTFALENGGLVQDAAIAVRDLVVAADWQALASEPDRARLTADWQRHSLDLRRLVFRQEGLTAEASLRLEDWQKPWQASRAELITEGQAGALAPLLAAANLLPLDLVAKGTVRSRLTLDATGEGTQRLDLDLHQDGAEWSQAGTRVLTSNQLQLKASLDGDLWGDGSVSIPTFALQTTLVRAEGKGEIRGGTPRVLELSGVMTPDLGLLAERMTAAVGQQVGLRGRTPSDFRMSLPLKSPLDLKQATLSATLHLDTVQFRGILLRGLDVPVEMGKGRIGTVLESELYGGRLMLKPQWHFAAPVPELRLPDNTRALKGVDVQSPLGSGVLARLHPLFGALARAEGSVDLDLGRFAWNFPKGKARQPVFAAVITIDETRFHPAATLIEPLTLFGLDQKALRLEPGAITCESRDGRVICEPVRLRCGDARMTLQGATGMDGSLDYRLRLPVTEHLVGKERFALLAGQTIEIPITGTLTAPRFTPEAVKRSLNYQLKRAAGKTMTPGAPSPPAEAGPAGKEQ